MKNIGHNKPPENFTDQEEKTDLEKLINDAGYEAVQRTTEYDLIEVTSKAV